MTRSVSVLVPADVFAISQNRCPNKSEVSGGLPGLTSFSIRTVARFVNGDGFVGRGVVEYTAKIESGAQVVPPAVRHTVATYCGRSEMLYSVMIVFGVGESTTLYVWIRKSGRSWRQTSRRRGATSMMDSSVPPASATTIVSP